MLLNQIMNRLHQRHGAAPSNSTWQLPAADSGLALDANLRQPDRHSPTIGILLCAGRNDSLVRYTLAGSTAPLAVANYTYDNLPPAARAAVPTDTQLANAADTADTADTALNQLTANPTPSRTPGSATSPTRRTNRTENDVRIRHPDRESQRAGLTGIRR